MQPDDAKPFGEGDSPQDLLGGFPRHLTHDLVTDAEAAERRRAVFAEWGVGLALASFALAFPVEVLVGRGVAFVNGLAAGAWSGPHLLPSAIVAVLGRIPLGSNVLGFERAAFLLSALALVLVVPLAAALGRRLGAPPRLATLGAVLVALTPAAAHAARLPGPGLPGLAVALALCAALLGRRGSATPSRMDERSVITLAVLAPLVDLTLIGLLPAVALASSGRGTRVGRRRALWATGLPIAVLAALHVVAAALDPAREVAALSAELSLTALALDGRDAPWSWAAMTSLAALGVTLAGLLALVLVRRGEQEQPPPAWLWVWCLVPLMPHTLGVLPPLWLLAPALLGALDLLSRAPEARALRVLAAATVLQLALLVATTTALQGADPLNEWRARAEAELGPGDVFLSADPDRLYLIGARMGLEVLDVRYPITHWSPRARTAAASGARLVLDEDALERADAERRRMLLELTTTRL